MYTFLKRHPSLQPLARDHGVGLVCAQRMQKASNATPHDRVLLAVQILESCSSIIKKYLDDEERILKRFITDGDTWKQLKKRHRKLRNEINALERIEPANDPGSDRMAEMARTMIEDYVRWEERFLFPTLETTLSDADLDWLGTLTSRIENKRTRPTQELRASIALDKFAGQADTCGCWMNR